MDMRVDKNMRFYAREFDYFATITLDIVIDKTDRGGDLFHAKSVQFEKVDPICAIETPTMGLTPEQAKQLMDELWRIGIRPSNGEGSVGQIGALGAHLADMRKIAFKKLEIDG